MISKRLGFGKDFSNEENEISRHSGFPLSESVRTVTPLNLEAEGGFYSFDFTSQDIEDKILERIKDAKKMFVLDGLFRGGIEKYIESFFKFKLKGSSEVVDYLKKRLEHVSLKSNTTFDQIVTQIITDVLVTGNCMVIKRRGKVENINKELKSHSITEIKRTLYRQDTRPISSLEIHPPDSFEPYRSEDGIFRGWKKRSSYGGYNRQSDDETNPINGRTVGSKDNDYLIDLVGTGDRSSYFHQGLDVAHFFYSKISGVAWGVSPSLTAVEAVRILRAAEQSVAVLIKKNSIPLTHHKINRDGDPIRGLEADIAYAAALHRKIGPDGVIITGKDHEIKTVGVENQALRAEGYLEHFRNRVFASLGVSPLLMGYGNATLGSAEAAASTLLSKVRFLHQHVAKMIEEMIFNELLYEAGYDPFFNPDHQVKLEFENIDPQGFSKIINTYIGLYTNNLASLEEVREMVGFDKEADLEDFYVNNVQIPLAEAKKNSANSGSGNPNSPIGDVIKTIESLDLSFLAEEDRARLLRGEFTEQESILIESSAHDPQTLQELLRLMYC